MKLEIQKKYNDELRTLAQTINELKQRMNDELATKEKEVKQLHL